MAILYRRWRVTARDVWSALDGGPDYATVRTQLRMLETKGYVRREVDGRRYAYEPTVSRAAASASELRHVLNTFFSGSIHSMVAEPRQLSQPGLDKSRNSNRNDVRNGRS